PNVWRGRAAVTCGTCADDRRTRRGRYPSRERLACRKPQVPSALRASRHIRRDSHGRGERDDQPWLSRVSFEGFFRTSAKAAGRTAADTDPPPGMETAG